MPKFKPDPNYTHHITTVDLNGNKREHKYESYQEAIRERQFLLMKAGPKHLKNSIYSRVSRITKKAR